MKINSQKCILAIYHIMNSFFAPFLYYKYLLQQLTIREIKSRYKQSIIGPIWIILNPLVQLLVYSFIFSIIFKFPTGGVPYSIFLFVGLLPWIYLQTSLSNSALVLVDNSNLLKKVLFPREVLPYSIILARSIDLFFASMLLIIFMFFYKIPISPSIIFFIPLFFLQVILMTGLSLVISAANLFYRDIQYVTNLILLMWMYLTPVVYPLSMIPKNYVWLYKLNPMVGIIEGYRSAFFNMPFDKGTIFWSAAVSLIFFIIAFWMFKKTEKVFADIV